MIRALVIGAALGLTALAPPASAGAAPPCRGVTCAGHGICVAEDERPSCFCDPGFVAERLACVPAPHTRRERTADGETIVAIARAEVGRDLRSVGLDRFEYPGALRDHVPTDRLWCTDFVSWVYRVAGAPLGGGYEGGWLVTNNRALRTFFEQRGLWIDRRAPSFRSFEPLPGDYVRIKTRTWGHSAIVDRVEGTTLHLVEGNARGVVRAIAYRKFRDNPRIDGFGIVTDARERRRWRAPPPLSLWRRARTH